MTPRLTVVDADGREKAFRPLAPEVRAAAVAAGVAAYRAGDFFEAHELLEPAWMGSDDREERAATQGLIKLAAAYVHEARGNPTGIAKNLVGARARLAEAVAGGAGGAAGPAADPALGGIDLAGLIADIDLRLADLAAHPDGPTLGPPILSQPDDRSHP